MRQPQRLRDLDKDEYQRILKRADVKIEDTLSAIIPIVKEVGRGNGQPKARDFFDKVRQIFGD
ncbi:unnamed protein product [marine sediment metagenome]|uniref:Uncharacterized protein n=1 Tax=marine sediment metagenome TaxID=412755 RepID=X1KMK4_9ZZZZ